LQSKEVFSDEEKSQRTQTLWVGEQTAEVVELDI
jgi:hypothetical protein